LLLLLLLGGSARCIPACLLRHLALLLLLL
jgi:hypothetical protein